MTILANTNNMMTSQNLEWYFLNSGTRAVAVWVSSDAEIIDILRVEKIDVLLYFTQRVDNRELMNFFFDICNVNPAVITILCIQEESRLYVSDNLRRSVDECITLPLSLADFTNLMRRCQRQPFAWYTPGMPAASSAQPHIVDVLIAERAPRLTGSPFWPLIKPPLYALLGYREARAMADAVAHLSGEGTHSFDQKGFQVGWRVSL